MDKIEKTLAKLKKYKMMNGDSGDKVRFNITMEKWLWYELKMESVKSGYSMKSIINAAIEDMIEAMKMKSDGSDERSGDGSDDSDRSDSTAGRAGDNSGDNSLS